MVPAESDEHRPTMSTSQESTNLCPNCCSYDQPAKIQQDLITTTSRSRTHRWGRPHHVECLNQNTSSQTTALTAQALNSFPHRKTTKATSQLVLSCTMHYVVSFFFWLCRLSNGSGKQNKFSSIHIQVVVHFHYGEFTCVEFTFSTSNSSQTSHKFQ